MAVHFLAFCALNFSIKIAHLIKCRWLRGARCGGRGRMVQPNFLLKLSSLRLAGVQYSICGIYRWERGENDPGNAAHNVGQSRGKLRSSCAGGSLVHVKELC